MEIIQNFNDFHPSKPVVATIGMFDGVHLGHQKLLEFLVQKADETGGQSALFSFDQHPRIVLYNDENIELLTTENEKIARLRKTAIDTYIPMHFTKKFAEMSAFEFVRDVLVNQFNISYLIVGHDHHFGRNREGNFEQLKEYSHMFDFKVTQFPAVDFDGLVISSTKIRNALKETQISQANAMLGYNYSLSGKVVMGKSKGKQLGFPTANVEPPKYKLIPHQGVYIAEAELGNHFYEAMVNIGTQPTLKGTSVQIEAHLLDFDEDIYGQILNLRFKKFLRKEEIFTTEEALKTQLIKDKEATRLYFKSF